MAGNQYPDHDTIPAFRRRFLEPIGALFTQILMIAAQMDMVALGDISIDETKVKANVSKHKAMSWERACQLEDHLSGEVAELLAAAETADNQSDETEQRAEARYEAEQAYNGLAP